MQQGGRDGGIIKLKIGQDRGNFQRMGKIWIARGTLLIAMGFHGVNIGPIKQCLIRAGVIGNNALNKLILAHHNALCSLLTIQFNSPAGNP